MRFAAPIVLAIFAVALFVVISGSSGGGSSSSQSSSSLEKQRDLGTGPFATRTTQQQTAAIPGGTYVVKSGDTLGAIAQRTGVPIATLQQLNPNVDPQTLVSGQKLKLR